MDKKKVNVNEEKDMDLIQEEEVKEEEEMFEGEEVPKEEEDVIREINNVTIVTSLASMRGSVD